MGSESIFTRVALSASDITDTRPSPTAWDRRLLGKSHRQPHRALRLCSSGEARRRSSLPVLTQTRSSLADVHFSCNAQRVTPKGEKPLSVAEYEEKYGVKAKDWAIERAKELGIYTGAAKKDVGGTKERGFKD